MRRSSALGSKTASGVNKTHYHIVTEALFSVDDDVSTSSLCQVERRKSKTLEYSNKVLQGPAAWGVVESAKAHTNWQFQWKQFHPIMDPRSGCGRLELVTCASLLWRRNSVACFHHLTCIALPHKSIHRNPVSLAAALSQYI